MADLSRERDDEMGQRERERRNRLVQTLAPRVGVGLVRAGLGLGCAICVTTSTFIFEMASQNHVCPLDKSDFEETIMISNIYFAWIVIVSKLQSSSTPFAVIINANYDHLSLFPCCQSIVTWSFLLIHV